MISFRFKNGGTLPKKTIAIVTKKKKFSSPFDLRRESGIVRNEYNAMWW